MLEGCKEGQQKGEGWSVDCASADREGAQGMEGEEGSGSCKDCPIFDSERVLELGATLAWRSSKLMHFSVRRDFCSELDWLKFASSLLVLSPCKSACLLKAIKVERADLVGWYDSGPSLTREIF